MSNIRILHNPRCSKSRQTLSILEQKGISPEIVLYLEDTPSKADLKDILNKLGLSAREVLRKGEEDYRALNLSDQELSEDALLDAMVSHPKLIERPIVIKGSKAIIGRPPENVLQLL